MSSIQRNPDLRSEPMDTAEGAGVAKRAWESWIRTVDKVAAPVIDPVAKRIAVSVSEDLLGFWAMWHLAGGYEGLLRVGYGRSTIYRKLKKFRLILGKHPDEIRSMPGITLDPEEFWNQQLELIDAAETTR